MREGHSSSRIHTTTIRIDRAGGSSVTCTLVGETTKTLQDASALTEDVKQPLFQFTNLLLQTGCFIFILTEGVLFFFLATIFPQ